MSFLDNPRVSPIDGGYRVINDESGPVKVLRDGPDWAVFFDWMGNEATAQLEELLAYRAGDAQPFARREFSQDVEVLR